MMVRRFWKKKPLISVIVVSYDMDRVLPRTLTSLSASYQVGINQQDYEIVVVDNGSPAPISREKVLSFGKNVRYKMLKDAPLSPALAVNTGVAMAQSDVVLVLIDGARLLTPGFLHHALAAFRMYPDAIVASPAWHLGPDNQQLSLKQGYCEEIEDSLLEKIDWPTNGYRLFEISSIAPNSKTGFLGMLRECNSLGVTAKLFWDLGGYEERFESVGGGFVNHDFYRRALLAPGTRLVLLPGEGNFHQVHGGVATNATADAFKKRLRMWKLEYEKIRGEAYQPITREPVVLGTMHREMYPYIRYSVDQAITGSRP